MAKEKEINVEINEPGDAPTDPEPEKEPAEAAIEGDGAETGDEMPSVEARLALAEDKLLRTMAEFDNYRKRTAVQFEQVIRSANEKLLLEMLEIVDNFERALQHSDDENNSESLRKGTELIYNQMQSVLKKYDVTTIESLGKPFDPNLHDAMMQTPSDTYAEGVVALELGKGYRIGERVLRHARVAVSTGAPQDQEQSPDAGA